MNATALNLRDQVKIQIFWLFWRVLEQAWPHNPPQISFCPSQGMSLSNLSFQEFD